jgi:hypothetical protein
VLYHFGKFTEKLCSCLVTPFFLFLDEQPQVVFRWNTVDDNTYAPGCDFPNLNKSTNMVKTCQTQSITECVTICKKERRCSAYVAFGKKTNSYYCTIKNGEFTLDDAKPFTFAFESNNNELEKYTSTCGLIESL